MKKYVLAPDSFKGTMTAAEVCAIWKKAILACQKDADIYEFPLSDGGEGMVDAYLRVCGGRRETVSVSGPTGEMVSACYGILPDGTAVLEMAACSGLALTEGKRDPMSATTRGVGELLLHAARSGAKNLILGLGGSATNDCGIGMAAALGYGFYDANGDLLEPLAKNMADVARIDVPSNLPELTVTAACDVDNPLFGPRGATYSFGAQKGVAGDEFAALDAGLANIAEVIARDLGIQVAAIPGAGAAGGLGAGVAAFLKGELKPGIDLLLDAANFDGILQDADMVFVGEGRMDWQSAYGKAPVGISRRAKKYGVPCIALCGSLGKGAEAVYNEGICAAFASGQGGDDLVEIVKTCREDMRRLADAVIRLLTYMN